MPKFKRSIKFIAMKEEFMTWKGYITEELIMLVLLMTRDLIEWRLSLSEKIPNTMTEAIQPESQEESIHRINLEMNMGWTVTMEWKMKTGIETLWINWKWTKIKTTIKNVTVESFIHKTLLKTNIQMAIRKEWALSDFLCLPQIIMIINPNKQHYYVPSPLKELDFYQTNSNLVELNMKRPESWSGRVV